MVHGLIGISLSVNWFRDVCLDNEWHIWCCPLDLFRWGLPHVRRPCICWNEIVVSLEISVALIDGTLYQETQGVNCYNPYKPETQPIQPAPALDPVPQVGPF